MNHTKGPWHFDGHGINDPDGNRICKVSNSEPYLYPKGLPVRNEQFDADSNLIAAAPELLECVKKLMKVIDDNTQGWGPEQSEAEELLKKLGAQ